MDKNTFKLTDMPEGLCKQIKCKRIQQKCTTVTTASKHLS